MFQRQHTYLIVIFKCQMRVNATTVTFQIFQRQMYDLHCHSVSALNVRSP